MLAKEKLAGNPALRKDIRHPFLAALTLLMGVTCLSATATDAHAARRPVTATTLAPEETPISARPFTPAITTPVAHIVPAKPDLSRFSDRRNWSCVPFVRRISAVQLRGDGWMWWQNAKGRYERGATPKPGAVMVFKRNGRMSRGHVAMVREIIDSRTIRIDHANWGRGPHKGKIDLGVIAKDVSKNNDWSLTRVWYTPINAMGDTSYPLYGFVYPTPVSASRSY